MQYLSNAKKTNLDFIDHCVGNQPDDEMEDAVSINDLIL